MKKFTPLTAILLCASSLAQAEGHTRTDFRIGWSIYVGWMPWGYLQDSGIMEKWADKYGISVEIVQMPRVCGNPRTTPPEASIEPA